MENFKIKYFCHIAVILIVIWGKVNAEINDKPFVSARIHGQMGNNFFQIAAASALAWDNGAEPYFPDLSHTAYPRVFFRCNQQTFPSQKVSFTWHEPSYAFHAIPYKANMKIDGYFQSEKHFPLYRDRLLKLFAPHPEDEAYIKKQYADILNHPSSVGVQIRYYQWEDPNGSLYPQFGREFLKMAMKHVPEESLFVITSNNLDFVRKEIPEEMKNVIFLENEKDYISFYVQSLCKHNIITNSSFGWWAAWLNENQDKKIIFPKQWIHKLPIQDVCPKEWISLDAPWIHPTRKSNGLKT